MWLLRCNNTNYTLNQSEFTKTGHVLVGIIVDLLLIN